MKASGKMKQSKVDVGYHSSLYSHSCASELRAAELQVGGGELRILGRRRRLTGGAQGILDVLYVTDVIIKISVRDVIIKRF